MILLEFHLRLNTPRPSNRDLGATLLDPKKISSLNRPSSQQ